MISWSKSCAHTKNHGPSTGNPRRGYFRHFPPTNGTFVNKIPETFTAIYMEIFFFFFLRLQQQSSLSLSVRTSFLKFVENGQQKTSSWFLFLPANLVWSSSITTGMELKGRNYILCQYFFFRNLVSLWWHQGLEHANSHLGFRFFFFFVLI